MGKKQHPLQPTLRLVTKWSLATPAANCIQQFPGIAEGRTRDIDTNPNLILRCVKSPWVNVETRLFPGTFTSNSSYHHTNPPPKTSLLLFALRVTLVFKEYHIECYHDQLLPDSIVLAIVSVKTNNVGFGKWSRVIWYIGILPKFCYLILVNGQFSWILSCCFFFGEEPEVVWECHSTFLDAVCQQTKHITLEQIPR